VDNRKYLVFSYAAGDAVINSTKIIVDGNNAFPVLESSSFYARIPWFYDYKEGDLTKYYLSSKAHTGLGLDDVPAIPNLLEAIQARYIKDTNKSIRHVPNFKPEDVVRVSLINHIDGVTANFNRITNAYQDDGILAGIVDDDIMDATLVEEIARG